MAYPENNIGDIPKDVNTTVIALVAPMVLVARLSEATDVINQTHKSGKEAGAMVLAITAGTAAAPTAFELRAAVGSQPADAWVPVTA